MGGGALGPAPIWMETTMTTTSAAMRHATDRRRPIWALAIILLAALAASIGACHATSDPDVQGERVLAPHCTEAAAGGGAGCTWAEIPPCPDDGGTIPDGEVGCYWDAAALGDGHGSSFTVWADDADR